MYKMWVIAHTLYSGGKDKLGRVFESLYQIVCSNSISCKANIGNSTVFYHHGLGCVVHDNAIIGENCKIFSNVTIGNKWSNGANSSGPPTIGNNVMIGAGTVILGEIHIGNNCIIGANSVVLNDLPDNSVAVGVPAKIIK